MRSRLVSQTAVWPARGGGGPPSGASGVQLFVLGRYAHRSLKSAEQPQIDPPNTRNWAFVGSDTAVWSPRPGGGMTSGVHVPSVAAELRARAACATPPERAGRAACGRAAC